MHGELALSSNDAVFAPLLIQYQIEHLTCTRFCVAFADDSYTVYGDNSFNQRALATFESILSISDMLMPFNTYEIQEMEARLQSFMMIVKIDNSNEVYATGSNLHRQLGDGSIVIRHDLYELNGLTGAVAISSLHHTLQLREYAKNEIYMKGIGWNDFCQIDQTGRPVTVIAYIDLSFANFTRKDIRDHAPKKLRLVHAGFANSFTVISDELYAWGNCQFGVCGIPNVTVIPPTRVYLGEAFEPGGSNGVTRSILGITSNRRASFFHVSNSRTNINELHGFGYCKMVLFAHHNRTNWKAEENMECPQLTRVNITDSIKLVSAGSESLIIVTNSSAYDKVLFFQWNNTMREITGTHRTRFKLLSYNYESAILVSAYNRVYVL